MESKYLLLLVCRYFLEFNRISSTILKYFAPAWSFITLPSSLPSMFIVFDKVSKFGVILNPLGVRNYKTSCSIEYQ